MLSAVIGLSILLGGPNAFASEIHLPPPSVGDLRLEADAVSMLLEDGTPYEEIVIRFPTHQLKFHRQASGRFLGEYRPELIVRNGAGNAVKRLGGGVSRLELPSEKETTDLGSLFTDMVQIELPLLRGLQPAQE